MNVSRELSLPYVSQFRGQSFFRSLLDRQLFGNGSSNTLGRGSTTSLVPLPLLIHDFHNLKEHEYVTGWRDDIESCPPPFVLKFSRYHRDGHMLAACDEDGHVTLVNTLKTNKQQDSPLLSQWTAHSNSVFDMAWMNKDAQITTASGDQTCRVWDVNTRVLLSVLKGHTGSVKTITTHPTASFFLATGSRDGAIRLWDTRIPGNSTSRRTSLAGAQSIRSVCTIENAHAPDTKLKKRKRKRRNNIAAIANQSVTSIIFLPNSNILASAGAADGKVKFWDLRKYKYQKPRSVLSLSQCNRGCYRPHGISCLSLSNSGKFLSVSSTDDTIYLYDVNTASCITSTKEIMSLKGHRNGSFYIKAVFSPDDRFIASGSSDKLLYIWPLSTSQHQSKPVTLEGHDGEVNDVDWCNTDFGKIASCSDDSTIRLWTIQRNRKFPGTSGDLSTAQDTSSSSSSSVGVGGGGGGSVANVGLPIRVPNSPASGDMDAPPSPTPSERRAPTTPTRMRNMTLVEMWSSPIQRSLSSPIRRVRRRRTRPAAGASPFEMMGMGSFSSPPRGVAFGRDRRRETSDSEDSHAPEVRNLFM